MKTFFKTQIVLLAIAGQLFYGSVVSAQQQIGTLYDNVHGLVTRLYDNGYFQADGQPQINGMVQRDPSGLNYLLIQARNPYVNAYYVNWNRQFIEVDRYQGTRILGTCDCPVPANPYAGSYKPLHYTRNFGVETPEGFSKLPDEIVDVNRPYGNVMLTTEFQAQQCYQDAWTGTTLDKEKFSLCMVEKMAGERELEIFNCVRNSGSAEERAVCLLGVTGGAKEREIAQKLAECRSMYGNDWSKYPLCMSETFGDGSIAKVLNCMQQQSKTGQVSFMGTALCYGVSNLDLNPETQIIVECAAATGGNAYAFAGCAGGQLLTRELDKCFTAGIGGSSGCFGENNEIVKGLKEVGELLKVEFGENNDMVKLWNNSVNDFKNGPGPNHEAVKVFRNLGNEMGRTSNKVGKAIKKAVPKIRITI